MNQKPDYSKYSNSELHEALSSIDKTRYPERHKEILSYIDNSSELQHFSPILIKNLKVTLLGAVCGLGLGYLSFYMFKPVIFLTSIISVVYLMFGIPNSSSKRLRQVSFWFCLALAPSIWVIPILSR